MRTMMVALAVIFIAPAIALAEPQRMDDDTRTPCENSKSDGKQPCNPDRKSIKPNVPTPAERDGVTVPPDIPAEGLPNQDKEPSSGNGSTQQQR